MAHAYIGGDGRDPLRLYVKTVWTERELIKALPGSRFDPNQGVSGEWWLPLSWASLASLRGAFHDKFTYDERVMSWAWIERRERIEPSLSRRELTEPGAPFHDLYDSRLHAFQSAGVDWMCMAGSGLLGDEMGTGKTIQMLTYMRVSHLHDPSEALPALVVCPNSVKTSWAEEAKKWFPECNAYVVKGSQTQKRELLATAAKDPHALIIINIEAVRGHSRLGSYGSIRLARCRECDPVNGQEGLRLSACESHEKELNRIPFQVVCVDEAHRMKDPRSKQTRACWGVLHGATVKHRWLMTGTPIANHPGELWALGHGFARDEFPTKTKFIDRYCVTAWNAHGGVDVVGVHPDRASEFYSFFDPRFRRMPKALVLPQLPEKVRTFRVVEMSTKQRRTYDQMANAMMTEVDGGLLTASSNLARRVRLLQLASSGAEVYWDDPGDWHSTRVELCEPSVKVDALVDILEDVGDKPVVVCAESRKLIELAAARLKRLKIDHGLIVGGMSEWERDDVRTRFQAGRLPVLLFTLKAGGVGLTLTRADTLIRLQRSDSMIDNKQGEDRVHRIGSEVHESVNIIEVVTADTVEMRQLELVHEKLLRLDEINRDRATLLRAGKSVADLDAQESMILAVNIAVALHRSDNE